MSTPYPYHILVVSPASILTKNIEAILLDKQIRPIRADTAKEAISTIKSHKTLFSLVIVQQELGDLPGVELLEQVKNLCKGALRILATNRFEKDLLMYAINRRLVHKYIGDPGDIEELTAAIESGIRRFRRFREDEDLFHLARKQNKKLYELNQAHMELSASRNKEIVRLNSQIKMIRNKLRNISTGHPDRMESLVRKIISFVQGASDPQKRFEQLFSDSLAALDKEFFLLQKKRNPER